MTITVTESNAKGRTFRGTWLLAGLGENRLRGQMTNPSTGAFEWEGYERVSGDMTLPSTYTGKYENGVLSGQWESQGLSGQFRCTQAPTPAPSKGIHYSVHRFVHA